MMSNLLDSAEDDVEMVEDLEQLRNEDEFGACLDSPPNFDIKPNTKEDKVSFTELINGQSSEGFWQSPQSFLGFVSPGKEPELKSIITQYKDERVAATLFALAVLEDFFES